MTILEQRCLLVIYLEALPSFPGNLVKPRGTCITSNFDVVISSNLLNCY